MGSWYFVALLGAVSAHLALGKVVELADSNFDSKMESYENALVMFYAPWCGHCKKIKPEFDKASSDLLANDPQVHLVKVDCTEAGKDVCGRFGVSGYPTLKIFQSGEMSSDYNGPREAPGIVRHMKAQVGPASREVTDDSALEKLLESTSDIVVVGFLKKSDEMDTFQKVATNLRENAQFAHSSTTSKVRKAGIRLHRPKHLRTKLEADVVEFTGDASDRSDLQDWFEGNCHGLVGHRTTDNSMQFDPRVPDSALLVAYYDVDYVKNPKGTNYWRNRVMKAAKSYEGKIKLRFAVSNAEDSQKEMDGFGFSAGSDDHPMVAITDDSGKKFVMNEEFSVDNLKAFMADFEAGKIEPYLKSEPVPKSNNKPVKVAVGKNFDELVTKSKKDVLVEFYAPWCGHCKSLAPVFDELGEKMAGENVEIVKMDATANDAPSQFPVQGFPTIYWMNRGKKPVPYNGGRELDDFITYIAKEATSELKGHTRSGKPKDKTEL